jgi:putative IMPACT (imprinted ancient) family translation regulator
VGWPPRERAADAGEPSGTAGQPILRALAGAGLSDVVAVVVRWFGGTKLGKGGLARAFAAATVAALAGLPTRAELAARELTVRLPYERIGAVKRLLRAPEISLLEERYGADVELRLRVAESALAELAAALAELRLEAAEPLA